MAHPISPVSQSSPTSAGANDFSRFLYRRSPVPRNEYVTVSLLASELGVDCERLRPLIERRYLRVMAKHDNFPDVVVARPPAAAMDWLRTMFMPLDLRPLIPVQQIIRALEITEDEFRYLCVTDNIPLYDDPVFGELMSVSGFYLLQTGWLRMNNPARSDRQALMLMLGILKNVKHVGRLKPLPYSQRIEKELSRVAHLPEPERTMRAADLWLAYNEAETITECLERYGETKQSIKNTRERLHARVDYLGRRALNQGGGSKFQNEDSEEAESR